MLSGKVIKLEKNYAIVMDQTLKCERIQRKAGLEIGSNIYYEHKDIYHKAKLTYYPIYKYAAASILVFVLLFGFLRVELNINSVKVETMPYAVVTIDINPSIQLLLDESNHIIEIMGLNEDGISVVSDVVLGITIDEAITKIIDISRTNGYLKDNDMIVITSVPLVKLVNKEESSLEELLNNYMEQNENRYRFIYYKGDSKEMEMANFNGISLGKYVMLSLGEPGLINEEDKSIKMTDLAQIYEQEIQVQAENSNGKMKVYGQREQNQNGQSTIEPSSNDEADSNEPITNGGEVNSGSGITNGTGKDNSNGKELNQNQNQNQVNVTTENNEKGKGDSITEDKDSVLEETTVPDVEENPPVDSTEDITGQEGQGHGNQSSTDKGNSGKGNH